MRKYICAFLSVCSLLTTASAQEPETKVLVIKGTYEDIDTKPATFDFDLTQGWRQDHFRKSSNGKSVPFKKHKGLPNTKVYETRVRMEGSLQNYFLRLDAGYGAVIKSGANFSFLGIHGNFGDEKGIKGGYAVDFKTSCGRECFFEESPGFFNESTSFTPLIGYMWGLEQIRSGKNKHVSFKWYSPYVGLAFKKEFGRSWAMYAEYDFAFLLPRSCPGYGNIGILGIGYSFTEHVALKAELELSHMTLHYNNQHLHKDGNASRTSCIGRLALNLAV